MNLLLDTQAFTYFVNGVSKLSDNAKSAILEDSNIKFVSIASVWEIAIKHSLNKLALTRPLNELPFVIDFNGFILQEIEMHDTLSVVSLPFHHRDSFDRLLIAQALNHNFTVVTTDSIFALYCVSTIQ